jgi:catechol 2,3-dioxygenase-like lactoylglutathione lyase family enzyme
VKLEEKETMTTGVSLHVADVEKSVAFYSKFPGAKLIMHRQGQFAKFKIGDGRIQVVAIPPE